MKDVIWESKLDGVYDVVVEGTGDYSGMLKVLDEGKVLLERPVSLSYGAMFGPDIGDVAEWERMACEFIDGIK